MHLDDLQQVIYITGILERMHHVKIKTERTGELHCCPLLSPACNCLGVSYLKYIRMLALVVWIW